MKEKFIRFMQGRYGTDQLSQLILGVSLVLLVVGIFVKIGILQWIPLLLLVYVYFRMFSRNISARYRENQKFLGLWGKIKLRFKRIKEMPKYHIYKCPSCSQKIRVPRRKGNIEIICPKCKTKFVKKS